MYETDKKQMNKLIAVSVVGLILLAVVMAIILKNHVPKPEENAPKGSLTLDSRADAGDGDGNDLASLLADREVYFAGIEDAVITPDTAIELTNMKENEDILMQYIITDASTGEVYEETGLIPSGNRISWVPGEQLENGSYTLVFHEKPFYPYEGEMIALTQGNNEVTITIQ